CGPTSGPVPGPGATGSASQGGVSPRTTVGSRPRSSWRFHSMPNSHWIVAWSTWTSASTGKQVLTGVTTPGAHTRAVASASPWSATQSSNRSGPDGSIDGSSTHASPSTSTIGATWYHQPTLPYGLFSVATSRSPN